MAEITAGMVKELREATDAPMMECKKALTEADGDMEKAEEILRIKLGNKASKMAGRIAAEGAVSVFVSPDGKLGRSSKSIAKPTSSPRTKISRLLQKVPRNWRRNQQPADVAALSALPLKRPTVEDGAPRRWSARSAKTFSCGVSCASRPQGQAGALIHARRREDRRAGR